MLNRIGGSSPHTLSHHSRRRSVLTVRFNVVNVNMKERVMFMELPMLAAVLRQMNATTSATNCRNVLPQMLMAYPYHPGGSNHTFQPASSVYGSARVGSLRMFTSSTTSRDVQQKMQSSTTDTKKDLPSGAVPSLRKVISPFLIICHPDKVPSSYEEAKQVNLNAVQTLNSFIDSVQLLYNALDTENRTKGQPLLSNITLLQHDIEFMVPSSTMDKKNRLDALKTSSLQISENMNQANSTSFLYTRRSVTLSIPSKVLQEVQLAIHANNTSNENSKKYQQHTLMKHAIREVSKLLKAAEIPIPTNVSSILQNADEEKGRGGKDKRQTFYIDWEEERKRYQQAVKDMEADIATLHVSDPSRQIQVVTNIVSRVRFFPSTINQLDQLITLRRLSLLLLDNFHTLYIEDYGELWEKLVIIVVADESTPLLDSPPSMQVPARRKKKQKWESGFKFSLRGERQIVVNIPLNFIDNQLIHEFTTHLPHFDMDENVMME